MENLLENIDLIHQYLSVSIKDQFCLQIDLKGEYTFAQNIVSKKTIIATTFTNKILSDSLLKLFVSSLIAEINHGKCSADLIRERIRHYEEVSRHPVRRIV
ncbi:hypothetical protein CLU96_2403 [Chryseobacterium sp. 52]|uniref:hypothetical protein n=1 Tax=Chryseobacterium sp. 52 TaxID=2035213 RepID=UPI000C1A08CC|nr:hypothetical protein [Chryseobacterium sp. 52]PIF45398.1 hypothetical protein CLU96_2403 [Chryseobacterium sp. 52]